MPTSRFLSTIPPPKESKVDLLKVDKTWAVEDRSLSDIQHGLELGVEKIGTYGNKSPLIQRIDAADMLNSLNLDIEACSSYQDKHIELKKMYRSKVRVALVVRGLLSPYSLRDKEGIELHKEYFRITSYYPKYITSLELMMELSSMKENLWTACFDFLKEQHCMVIEDWDKPLEMSIGIFSFDRTMAFDGSDVYRGESDASFFSPKERSNASGNKNDNNKKPGRMGMACCAIWNHKNEVLSSIFVKGFTCNQGSK